MKTTKFLRVILITLLFVIYNFKNLQDSQNTGITLYTKENNKKQTVGIITDGDIKRATQKNANLKLLKTKKIMNYKPKSVSKNILAAHALSIMNTNKITGLCVHSNNIKKTVGFIHIHSILKANIQ